jgi:transposase-like protein
MAKEMDGQVKSFCNQPLEGNRYPVLWVDALYEKVRYDGRVVSMAILLVCGVNEAGAREVLAVEPMLEESRESYAQLFERLKGRGLSAPSLVISDAHAGLVAVIRESFPGACWQRCKVHFMRNILVRVPYRDKQVFAVGYLMIVGRIGNTRQNKE